MFTVKKQKIHEKTKHKLKHSSVAMYDVYKYRPPYTGILSFLGTEYHLNSNVANCHVLTKYPWVLPYFPTSL